MKHANSGAALARRPGQSGPRPIGRGDRDVTRTIITFDGLTPADLELDQEARGVWASVFEGINVVALFSATKMYHRIAKLTRKSGDRYCPLEALAELVVWCANREISEARVRLVLVWLDGIIADVYAGKARPSLDDLDLEEQELENRENSLSWRRRIHQQSGVGVTRAELEEEALINQREAAVSIARARELLRLARRLPETLVATTQGVLA